MGFRSDRAVAGLTGGKPIQTEEYANSKNNSLLFMKILTLKNIFNLLTKFIKNNIMLMENILQEGFL